MTTSDITKDLIYDSVAPDDFEAMLELDRYGSRSSAFDRIISATHEHYWDPLNPKYIDFSAPFDMENQMLVPEGMIASTHTHHVSSTLTDWKTRVRFVNESVLRSFSTILHGEQGALNLSASLCHVLKDQGAQEYAANQTREEARHVTAFAGYIRARWGRPKPSRSSPRPRSTRRSSACRCWWRASRWAPSPPTTSICRTRWASG